MVRFSEHRLIYATQSQLEAQRLKAGVTVQNDMTKKPTRVATDKGTMSATEYAAAQQRQRQVSNEPATAQSFMDANGRDTRFTYDADGNRSEGMTSAGIMAPIPTVLGSNPYQAPERIVDQHLSPLNSSQQGEQRRLAERQKTIEERVNEKYASEGRSQTLINDEIASEYNMNTAKQDAASTEAGNDAASSAAATEAQSDPMAAGMQGFLANLPPEAQALAPLFENILHSISAGQEESAKATEAMLNGGTLDVNGNPVQVQGLNPAYDAMEKKIADMEAGYTQMQEGIQGMLDKAAEQQEKAISEQEKAAKDRMAWQETDMLRQAAREKQAAVDSRIARLALTGGFGSDGGLREIEETRASYENRMDDIKTEFGIQRTELAAKFTGMYLEASNNHLNASIQNIKDTASALERIAGQSLSTKQARMSAENSVLTNFLSTQTAARKEYATELKNYAGTMQEMIDNSRESKRVDAERAFEEMKWIKSTYGSNVPSELVSGLQARLPGYDVAGLLAAPTDAEVKAARKRATGGGGGGVVGSFYANNAGALPTFDEFIAAREQELNRSMSAPAREALRKEFDAEVAQAKAYSVDTINQAFDDKVYGNPQLSKHAKEDAKRTLDNYLANGQQQLARNFVDGFGKPPTGKESENWNQAMIVKQNMAEINVLLDDLGAQGPAVGRARQMNPYDSRVVRLNQLITQTIPSLARGIYKEVGVLTDTDIATYRSTLANPNLTYEQAKQATEDTLRKIQLSMDTQLETWSAQKLAVRDFRAMAEREPDVSAVFTPPGTPQSTPSQGGTVSDYVRSLSQ